MHALRPGEPGAGPVVYWMHRDHRARDNWGLLHAQELAARRGAPLAVCWCLARSYGEATLRQFGFLLRGMARVERHLARLNIPLFLLRGDPGREVPAFVDQVGAGALVTDFDPVRVKRGWVDAVAQAVAAPVLEVDSRNIVPCRAASDKREYAARTIRPKIHRLLPEYLHDIPAPRPHPAPWPGPAPAVDWEAVLAGLDVDRSVPEAAGPEPGEDAALAGLERFTRERLDRYILRNDPGADAVSGLSPWLHFGMLSAQRAALAASSARGAGSESRAAFLEELVVRRELADNFCLHAPDYDSASCFPDWAKRTLDRHRGDARPYLYSLDELDQARTHDHLWNAAQRQMRRTGSMHGYMRMYWAKKILEWSATPEQAMAYAVRLNDRYLLDGRDPNGYAGIAWSMGGVHDRPWAERPVFGTVRYMNAAGCARKFDVARYVERNGE